MYLGFIDICQFFLFQYHCFEDMLIRGQWKLYFYGLLSLNFDDHLISWTEAARQFTESYGQQILVLMKPKY